MNRTTLIIAAVLAALSILILGFFLKMAQSDEVVVLRSDRGLESALGKAVFLRAELYCVSEVPLLKFGSTWLHCSGDSETAEDIVRKYGCCEPGDPGIKVDVWGTLGRHYPLGYNELTDTCYEVKLCRIEVDEASG